MIEPCLRRDEGNSPQGRRSHSGAREAREGKKSCSHPKALGREQNCFVVPPKFETQTCLLCGLLLRGESRGRFRPRSAAVLRLSRTGHFQLCVPLCGSNIRVLLRHPSGFYSIIVCVFAQKVKRWDGWRDSRNSANPDRPGQGPAPAFRQWRCCWRRGCCSGRTDGRCKSPRRPTFRCGRR